MSDRLFQIVQAMNAITVVFCVICCLHVSSVDIKAEPDGGALTVVQQDEDSGVTLEDGDSDDVSTETDQPQADPFHPTHEWQTIKEGQTIPAGLHVRMDFQTGLREAKLMEGTSEFQYWKDGDRQGMLNMDKKQFSMNELKRALKDFKTTELDDTDLQREAEVKKTFRSYNQLKKEFHDMKMDIKTDGEIIGGLIEQLKHEEIPRDDLLMMLTDLEYYLHQIDNAVLFKDLGGLPYILKLMNTTTDEQLQMEAAMVLGAATSSNPKVQISALEAGALQLLLRLMSFRSSIQLQRKIMFCISTLCRNFPYAQKRFLELGGLSAIRDVFNEAGTERLRVKAVSFLNDLLIEKKLTEEKLEPDKSSHLEKLNQYNQVPLLAAMKEQGWCERIPTLLELSDHDSREQVLTVMQTLVNSCKPTFIQSRDKLNRLRSEYIELARGEENGEDYFTNLVSVIDNLIEHVSTKDEL